jgi:DNA repair exonuclease SbcCD nuclease subunit
MFSTSNITMKIGIVADNHLGYPRFEEDSYIQAERAMLGAAEKCDVIINGGDIFDARIPKLETLQKGMELFSRVKVPVFAIYGNHERRTKEMTNPVQLLLTANLVKYLHGTSEIFEKEGEKIQIFGIGNIPDRYAKTAVEKALERFVPEKGAFKILVIHQTISDILKTEEEELSFDFLEGLPFDLIINGHIHRRMEKLAGKVIMPGSTVITQLKKEETEPKGYYIYDTKTKKTEFFPIECRKFFHEELNFENVSEEEVRKRVREKIEELHKQYKNAIILVKLKGRLREGLLSSDIALEEYDDIYIVNELNAVDIKTKLDKIRKFREEKLSVKEIAIVELEKRLEGKITMFKPSEFFDKLVEGSEEALEYLEKK